MTLQRKHERGEGKIGCIITLLVMVVLAGIAFKVVPVFFANNNLVTAAEDLGSRAAILGTAGIEQQLRAKAAELEIPEALPKGAMTISLMGDRQSGTCVIRLKFTRKVDLYGAYTLPITMEKTINRPYMDAR